ncbi:hypothetical protein PHYPSEUDO_002451 [Phytophthora pseudosyringae]|uniref:Uncharacterized protein n=1 Tax=Phytophthora pseudosyringae TaxID=221518 RepID=A0A8T1VTS9_9STRA|nr:hypothetical protein PHYPSEUDO_002451 [Phytophthora pseudosyringae]
MELGRHRLTKDRVGTLHHHEDRLLGKVDCNTLAELVHDAYIHGADMTGPIFFEPEPLTDQNVVEASV